MGFYINTIIINSSFINRTMVAKIVARAEKMVDEVSIH